MKKNIKKTAAVIAAAMTISAMGIPAYAKGWENTDEGAKYVLDSGKNAANGLYTIDGTVYRFSEDGFSMGKYTGWAKKNGVRRYYKDGAPYTGWLKSSAGRKYALDGWLMTGEFPIGDSIYKFDKNGIYESKTAAPVILKCPETVSVNAKEITVDVSPADDNYYICEGITKIEHWENGKWVDCAPDGFPVADSLLYFTKDEQLGLEFGFDMLDGGLSEGYYRLTLYAGPEGQNSFPYYAIFNAQKAKSGWVKEDGVNRYYKNDSPYTGWLKNKDGQKRYVLDGWLVKDSIQIGDTHYIFNDNGYLSGQQKLAISADCGTVTTADDHITVKLTMLSDGHESFGALSSLERWENGKWVESGLGEIPVTMELHALAKKGETEELTLYLHDFKLTKGIYRIPINNHADTVGVFSLDGKPIANTAEPNVEHFSTYTMFEVK